MQSISMRKITISLPQDLVEFADRAAHQADISRSQVISQALAEAQARNERRLAEEGYRFYARESAEFNLDHARWAELSSRSTPSTSLQNA